MRSLLLRLLPVLLVGMVLVSCAPADVVSRNLSTEADQFKIMRRIVFINGITDKYLLSITGYCSLGNNDPQGELSVTCMVGPNQYKKHFLGLSDNVTYMVEQIDPSGSSQYHYEVIFNPATIVPDIRIP